MLSSSFNDQFALAKLLFPYPNWNEQQLRIIRSILTLKDQSAILIESPTGSGKTVASLTALLARRQPEQKIIVFVRTVSQIEPILREWGRIHSYNQVGLPETPLILPMIGKTRMCKQMKIIQSNLIGMKSFPASSAHTLCKSLPCKLHPDHPEYNQMKLTGAKFHLQNLNRKIIGVAKSRSPAIGNIIEFLNKKKSCGYYDIREMLQHAGVIVATYPYMKQPLLGSIIKRMSVQNYDILCLVDEAHNLVDEQKSEISKQDITKMIGLTGRHPLLMKMVSAMKGTKRILPTDIAPEEQWAQFTTIFSEATLEMREKLGISLAHLGKPEVQKIIQFCNARISCYAGGHMYIHPDKIQILEPTPAPTIAEFDEFALQVYQSGTFYPIDAHKKLFGLDYAEHLIIKPNNRENRFKGYLLWKGVTSKYDRRGPKMYITMSEIIAQILNVSPRHVLVVCPSYEFKENLTRHLKEIIPDNKIIEERRDTITQELTQDVRQRKEPLVMVGVNAGKISEGVEFVHNGQSLLSTVIFAGLPFAPMNDDNLLLQNIRTSVAADAQAAREFQMKIPIIRAIKQAFGRTIRSSNDMGALIILDFRAEMLLKRDLELLFYKDPDHITEELKEFFSEYTKLMDL